MKIISFLLNNENFFVFGIIPIFWSILFVYVNETANYWLEFWWMFPIAFIIAVIVNTVGISGAALFVPFFVVIFPFLSTPIGPEQSVKVGLITESFGLSSSALAFLRYGLVDRKIGILTVAGAAPFVIGGAFLSFYIPKILLQYIIAFALMISVYLLLNEKRRKSKHECILKDVIDYHIEGHHDNATLVDMDGKTYYYCRRGYGKRFLGYGAGGLFQGLAGFGIGELGIISMVLTNIPIRVAIGTSHLIVALTAVIASSTHVLQSLTRNIETPWNIVFVTVPAVITGGQVAPYVSAKLRTSVLENFVAVLFSVLVIALIYPGLKGI